MDKTVIDVLLTPLPPLPVIHLLHIIQMLCVTTVWIAARLAYCQKAEHTQNNSWNMWYISSKLNTLPWFFFSRRQTDDFLGVYLDWYKFLLKVFHETMKNRQITCFTLGLPAEINSRIRIWKSSGNRCIALYTFTLHTSYVQYIHNACRLEQHLFSQGVLVYHWLDVTWYKTSRFRKGWA